MHILKTKIACLDDNADWTWTQYHFDVEEVIGWWVTNDAAVEEECVNLHLPGHAITVILTDELKDWLYLNRSEITNGKV
jgi:hypothetical protein